MQGLCVKLHLVAVPVVPPQVADGGGNHYSPYPPCQSPIAPELPDLRKNLYKSILQHILCIIKAFGIAITNAQHFRCIDTVQHLLSGTVILSAQPEHFFFVHPFGYSSWWRLALFDSKTQRKDKALHEGGRKI
jgi:hypothetical protein